MAATALVLGALVAGTIWGQDDHFPFGPFRMYSTTTSDHVTVLVVQAETLSGDDMSLRPAQLGLRPAELHGQIARFEGRLPELLRHLVTVYERRNTNVTLARMTLSYGIHQLEAGRPVAYREQLLAQWERA